MSKVEKLQKLFLLTEELPFSFWRNLRDDAENDPIVILSRKERIELKKEGMPPTPLWKLTDEKFQEINQKIQDLKKNLNIDSFSELVKGIPIRDIGIGQKPSSKNQAVQWLRDYDNPSDKTPYDQQKSALDYYIRNNYFYLGDEDKLFLDAKGRYTTESFEEFKRINEVRKKYKEEAKAKGLVFPMTGDEEEEFYNLKELSKSQILTETQTETETETPQIPAAAPAPAEIPQPNLDRQKSGEKRLQVLEGQVSPRRAGGEEAPATAQPKRLRGSTGITFGNVADKTKLYEGNTPAQPVGGEEEKADTNPAQTTPAINSLNTAKNFAEQSTAPSDAMPETMPEQQTTPDDITPILDEGVVEDTLNTPRADPDEPSFPSGMTPDEEQLLRDTDELLGRGLEDEGNKNPSVSMDITKDRINIGEKVDDIPTETILDKIPESRFSSQFKTIKQLNDDIKYFIKNFGNVVGKDLIKQYNNADKTNLELIRRLHGLIGGKLKTDNQKEKKVGIIIDADEYINQKINDALLNRGVSMNVPAGVRTNLESEAVKEDKSIGNFDVRKAREGGLLAVRREPVYRYIPSNNEAMNKPIDSRKEIKNGGLRMLPTQRRDLSITARKQVRDDPFARKHNPRKLICLY